MRSAPQPVNPGSSSKQPDLSWSQAKETITMLCLATAQVEAAQKDAAESVSSLVNSFTKIASDSQRILHTSQLVKTGTIPNSYAQMMESAALELNKEINDSIVSFQFHDRISQKLSHVNHGLSLLANLISDSKRIFNPEEWQKIQDEIAKSYTLECERLMLKKILEGATIFEALLLYESNQESSHSEPSTDANKGDIELF